MNTINFPTTLAKLGELLETIGKRMQEGAAVQPPSARGELGIISHPMIEHLEMGEMGSYLKLNMYGATYVEKASFKVGDATVAFPKLLIRDLQIRIDVLPEYQDGLIKLFEVKYEDPK